MSDDDRDDRQLYPPPGTPEAIARGCRCAPTIKPDGSPVLDPNGKQLYSAERTCPLHGNQGRRFFNNSGLAFLVQSGRGAASPFHRYCVVGPSSNGRIEQRLVPASRRSFYNYRYCHRRVYTSRRAREFHGDLAGLSVIGNYATFDTRPGSRENTRCRGKGSQPFGCIIDRPKFARMCRYIQLVQYDSLNRADDDEQRASTDR
jgi:hypothetical protein